MTLPTRFPSLLVPPSMNLMHFRATISGSTSQAPTIVPYFQPISIRMNFARVRLRWRLACSLRSNSKPAVPARDKVIDFGKHKGKMLGTLPSNYLKWMSENLRAPDFEEWANLAEQVLQDPVYKDRIEWEHAENLLTGNNINSYSRSSSAVAELLEISETFGWDNDDKDGWSKVNFELLGTSRGGRIPRKRNRNGAGERAEPLKEENFVDGEVLSESEGGGERWRRRMRLRRQRQRSMVKEWEDKVGIKEEVKGSLVNGDGNEDEKPFPGREAFLRKVLKKRPN